MKINVKKLAAAVLGSFSLMAFTSCFSSSEPELQGIWRDGKGKNWDSSMEFYSNGMVYEYDSDGDFSDKFHFAGTPGKGWVVYYDFDEEQDEENIAQAEQFAGILVKELNKTKEVPSKFKSSGDASGWAFSLVQNLLEDEEGETGKAWNDVNGYIDIEWPILFTEKKAFSACTGTEWYKYENTKKAKVNNSKREMRFCEERNCRKTDEYIEFAGDGWFGVYDEDDLDEEGYYAGTPYKDGWIVICQTEGELSDEEKEQVDNLYKKIKSVKIPVEIKSGYDLYHYLDDDIFEDVSKAYDLDYDESEDFFKTDDVDVMCGYVLTTREGDKAISFVDEYEVMYEIK